MRMMATPRSPSRKPSRLAIDGRWSAADMAPILPDRPRAVKRAAPVCYDAASRLAPVQLARRADVRPYRPYTIQANGYERVVRPRRRAGGDHRVHSAHPARRADGWRERGQSLLCRPAELGRFSVRDRRWRARASVYGGPPCRGGDTTAAPDLPRRGGRLAASRAGRWGNAG